MIENTDTKRASGAPLYVVNGAVAFSDLPGSRLVTLILPKLANESQLYKVRSLGRYFALLPDSDDWQEIDGHAFTM